MSKQIMQEEWNSFRKSVMEESIGGQQLHDMRIAFFAGATSLFTIMIDRFMTGDVKREEQEDLLFNLQNELKEFLENLQTEEPTEK